MRIVLLILLLLAMAGVVYVLVRGVIAMASGRDVTGEQSQMWMRRRVLFQAAAVVIVILILAVAGAGASMVSYFIRNQKDIVKKVGVYRTLIGETRDSYEELQNGWRSGRHDVTGRNLMIDGLMKRFLSKCDEV